MLASTARFVLSPVGTGETGEGQHVRRPAASLASLAVLHDARPDRGVQPFVPSARHSLKTSTGTCKPRQAAHGTEPRAVEPTTEQEAGGRRVFHRDSSAGPFALAQRAITQSAVNAPLGFRKGSAYTFERNDWNGRGSQRGSADSQHAWWSAPSWFEDESVPDVTRATKSLQGTQARPNAGSGEMSDVGDSLKGQFLIAGRWLRDPNFFKTVVLIVEHGRDGAMGLVMNRPSSIALAHALSEHVDLSHIDDVVYVGGPVEPAALFILHNGAKYDQPSALVVPDVYVGSNAQVFERVVRAAANGDPDLRFRVFCGCAGWGPGQLEGELSRGDWHLYPATADLVWHSDPYMIWDELLSRVYEKNRLLPHTVKNPEWN